MSQTLQLQLDAADMADTIALFGLSDRNIQTLEKELGVRVALRGSQITITGEQRELAARVALSALDMARQKEPLDPSGVRYAIELARADRLDEMPELLREVVSVTHRGRPIKCKTLGQRDYVRAMQKNQLTFCTGPAGTGKTYLAMAMAVVALKNREVERLILTRPAVEAGEKLGFLPGDMAQKVDPYLRPLYDALGEIMGADAYARLSERGVVEVAPLAFMRGRTLSEAFIILDEAQNATSEQMKMFLTRLGQGSRCVVTGDPNQTDLPPGRRSGLLEALELLQNIDSIAQISLTHKDVVRHDLVMAIVMAYERKARGAEDTP